MKDDENAVARQIASTGGQLEEVAKALAGWKSDSNEETSWLNHFKAYVFHRSDCSEHVTIQLLSTLEDELRKLEKLGDRSNFKKFLEHEDEQARVSDIFVHINEARVQFEVRTITLRSSMWSQCRFYVARIAHKSF